MRILAAVLLCLALAPPIPAGSASSTPREFQDTGERFRTPLLGREYRILVDGAGEKAFVDADGLLLDSAEAAVRAEETTLPLARRIVHPELWPLLDDPARSEEAVRVVLVLRRQPVRDAGIAARAVVGPLVAKRLVRLRAALGEIAPHRKPDPGRTLQLGDRIEEEAALLDPATRAELKDLRAEILDLVRGMRREVFDGAKPLAALDQEPVVERVGRLPGGRVLATSFVLSAVVAEVPAGSLARLAEDLPSVARILPHGVRRPGLDISVGTLGATTWASAGYDGSSSTKVAVMDTGVDAAHPALSSVVGAQSVHLAVGKTDPYFQDNANSTDDIFGHGTHVAGIVMSQDATYKGVAPGGVLVNAKCGYNSAFGGNLQDGDIMAAGDWAADNGADAVNASFGGGGTTDGSSDLSLWFDALVDGLGVFAAVAAGNAGPGAGSVGIPGDAYNVVTVGSLNDNGTATHSDNSISSFSSRGPLSDNRRKPDLCAPGSAITSCNYQWEGGGTANDFVSYDGTSMATPHIAGAAAILFDYAASWRPEGLKALLLSTTRNTSPYATSPDNTWGWGAADMTAAYTSRGTVVEGSLTSSGPAFAFFQVPTLNAGKRATLCWNRDVSWNDASTPTSYRALADLDLYAYDEVSHAARGSAQGTLNPVEQVALTATTTFPLLKVKRKGSLPSGQSTVEFAVACEGSGSAVRADPPSLACDLVLGKAFARPGDVFTAQVILSVGSEAELNAVAPAVTLSLPAGYSLQSGTPTQTLLDIAPGGSRTATWTVVAGGAASGPALLGASAACTEYGETFTSPAITVNQPFDAVGPTGAIQVQGGADAVNGTGVTVSVFATDDSTGVTDMRVRNAEGSWDPWVPYAASFPWTLGDGEGSHTVQVQLMDAAGNPSGILEDSILVDTTAPTGSFVLSGGAPYLLPGQALTADTSGADGAGGSGVTEFRVRWTAAGPWSSWILLNGNPVVPLQRPPQDEGVQAEGQFRDAAGNASASSFARIHLVPANPPSLSAVRTYRGTLAANGDIDAFVIGALPGDVLSVKVRSSPSARGGEFLVDADLFDPEGSLVAAGRYPEGAKRPGIAKFSATLPGDHSIVLRSTGADAAAGGSYTLTVKVATAKANRRILGPTNPTLGTAYYTFQGIEGSLAAGAVRGPVSGSLTLQDPDGSLVPVAIGPLEDGVRVLGMFLGRSGTYVLRVPASGPLLVDLKVKPPKRLKVVESGD